MRINPKRNPKGLDVLTLRVKIRKIKKHWPKAFLILIGIGIRLVLAGTTVHSDLLSISAGDFLLRKKGILNIYDYLAQALSGERLIEVYGRTFFTYPPLAYFTLGLFNILLSPFFSGSIYTKFLGGVEAFSGLGFDWDLLVLKLPYLIFDLLLAFSLFKIFEKDKRKAWWAFYLWLFNPISWYTSFLIGQFDIIPTFLVLLSAYLIIKDRYLLSALSLGLGASLKMFPLFFLPILIFVLGKNVWQKMKLGLIGFLPYLITILPFIKSSHFRQTVLFSGQSQKMLFATLPVSGAEGIYFFIFGTILVYFYTAWWGKKKNIWQYYFWVLLLFFSLTHYHPQWFLWVTPFLIWAVVKNGLKQLWLGVILFACWLIITLLFEPSLSIGLFAPLYPQMAKTSLGDLGILPGGRQALGSFGAFQIKSIARSIFAATSFFWWIILK